MTHLSLGVLHLLLLPEFILLQLVKLRFQTLNVVVIVFLLVREIEIRALLQVFLELLVLLKMGSRVFILLGGWNIQVMCPFRVQLFGCALIWVQLFDVFYFERVSFCPFFSFGMKREVRNFGQIEVICSFLFVSLPIEAIPACFVE